MHLRWMGDPVQPQLARAIGTKNSLKKFVSFAINTSNAYHEIGCGVCEFKNAEDWLMDAANAVDKTNDLYVAKQEAL